MNWKWLSPWILSARRILFWIVCFFLLRALLLLGRISQIRMEGLSCFEISMAFLHALPLDLATASYFLIPWWIIMILILFKKPRIALQIEAFITGVLIIFTSVIYLAEIAIFPEWGAKITWKAFLYLENPKEIILTAGPLKFVLALTFLVILSFLGIKSFLLARGKRKSVNEKQGLSWLILIIISPALLLVGMRGGVGAIPINQSNAYYSSHYILNTLAVNSVFHLGKDYLESHRYDGVNPFATMEDSVARNLVSALHHVTCDSTLIVIKTHRPNIVLIILESWTADAIGSLGGEPGITPNFDSLSKEGLLFTQCYVSGNRSQQAMASIYSGFPALPQTAITHHYEKFIKLPSLVNELDACGYNSLFVFGGELAYGGIKAYLLHNRFDHIIEGKDFPRGIKRGYLGVHDEDVFDRFSKEISKLPQPFFASVFTLSSHSPYDQPWPEVIKTGGHHQAFLNSVNYTDHCLGSFFRQAAKTEWYPNTLFILVSDHSHFTHIPRTVLDAAYHHIPMLWMGAVLKPAYQGSTFDQIASQTDIARSLLAQLGLDDASFSWSRNLFNPCIQEYAYFEHNQGFGWIRPEGHVSYNIFLDYLYQGNASQEHQDSLVQEGKAYLQVLFATFQNM